MRMLAVYHKAEDARFISHLDILRALQRAFRRAGLPLKYSDGFNPHPELSFASALATGIFAGCIGTSQNAIPAHFAKICELAKANDFAAAAKLQAEVVKQGLGHTQQHERLVLYDVLLRRDPRPRHGAPL